MLFFTEKIFSKLERFWEGRLTPRLISSLLIILFLFSLFTVFVVQNTTLGEYMPSVFKNGYFFALDVSFTALLVFEILGLIFVLPKSVADSVGKQFEILSIILLRSAFKEFGHYSEAFFQGEVDYSVFAPMLADAFGALIIFFILGFYYQKQKHGRITQSKIEQDRFISFKKSLAFLLLVVFTFLGVSDVISLFQSGHYESSFHTFYNVLIFADILILIYSLRFQSRYINLFRYSSFAFATLLIRMSLSAPSYLNVITGVMAGGFVLGLTLAYNYFRKEYDELS